VEDFKEIFDVAKLDEYELGQIEFILTHPAFESHFRPYMQRMHDSCVKLWKIPLHRRSSELTDEDLKAGARFIDGMMAFFDKLVMESRDERILRSQGLVPDTHAQARESGQIKSPPMHPGEPDYDAALDF